jgi:hypothetical protein
LKRIAIVLVVSAAHFGVSFGLFLGWLKMKMDLVGGDYRPLSAIEKLVKAGGELLAWPLVSLFPGIPVWFAFGINSLMWGTVLCVVVGSVLAVSGMRRQDRQAS